MFYLPKSKINATTEADTPKHETKKRTEILFFRTQYVYLQKPKGKNEKQQPYASTSSSPLYTGVGRRSCVCGRITINRKTNSVNHEAHSSASGLFSCPHGRGRGSKKQPDMLRIAIQAKGRLNEQSLELLAEAGIRVSDSKRKLISRAEGFPLEVIYLRDDDIPQAVAMGVVDLGIVGLTRSRRRDSDVDSQ